MINLNIVFENCWMLYGVLAPNRGLQPTVIRAS
jgi:hypothetical protein